MFNLLFHLNNYTTRLEDSGEPPPPNAGAGGGGMPKPAEKHHLRGGSWVAIGDCRRLERIELVQGLCV